MSKLINRLQQISRGEVHHMGFGNLQAAAPRIPALAIVALIPGPEADFVKIAVDEGADALLIKVNGLEEASGPLEQAIKAAGDVPFGVQLESALPDDIGRLTAAGVDFLVIQTETAPSVLLRQEKVGRVAAIDPYLDDSLLRTLDRLAVDAVLVELEQGSEEFLTVRDVMACRRSVDMVRKPVLLRVSSKLSAADLANIRDLGIEGVVIDLSGSSTGETLTRLRKAIAELPPRRKPRESMDAHLPRQSPAPEPEPDDDEL